MTPEEVPAILLQMALMGEGREQMEALEWTAQNAPEFLQWMTYYPKRAVRVSWKTWPTHGDNQTTEDDVRASSWIGWTKFRIWQDLYTKELKVR